MAHQALGGLAALVFATAGLALPACADTPRAKPPTFSDDEKALFPADARKLLAGPRPDFARQAPTAVASAAAAPEIGENGYQWSAMIAAETVEAEIKRQANKVAGLVRSATSFKGGGYRDCRDAFTMLALMFSIAAEHDEDARWSSKAAGLSVLFARAGANCKVGTDGSFREASARSEDLAELVRGGRPDVPAGADNQDWGALAARAPVMRRMEVALEEQLKPAMASDRAFGRASEDAYHEAQVLAALAEIITRPGFEDGDDEEYVAYARTLRDASTEMATAAENETYDLARPAYGKAGQSCSACHEDYRG